MEAQEINRRLHEALGKCWHETERRYVAGDIKSVCKKCNAYGFPILQSNPNYCADPRLVIEAMIGRRDWIKFLKHITNHCMSGYASINNFTRDRIMDRTGKLAVLATEWINKQKGKSA